MSLPAMSLGLRFCVSRKGRTGGGGWVHQKGANSMATSGLVFRSDLVGTGTLLRTFYLSVTMSHLNGCLWRSWEVECKKVWLHENLCIPEPRKSGCTRICVYLSHESLAAQEFCKRVPQKFYVNCWMPYSLIASYCWVESTIVFIHVLILPLQIKECKEVTINNYYYLLLTILSY